LLNGDLAQGKRQSTLNDFKEAKIKILVTTDVAARGLNMENVGLVINFEVPADAQSYIHRIGRTGRAGASGKAIMLVSALEK
jgi:ATP-dependent RNA helicase DeaD